MPPRILPDISKKGTEAVSVNHADFVKLPVMLRKNYKPEEKVHECEAKLEDTTSYKLDFSQQKLASNRSAAGSLMRTTIPKIDEIPSKEYSTTMNQSKWDHTGKQAGFTEHPTQLHYTGKSNGKSSNGIEDYNAAILEKGRTKSNRSVHASLPALVERQPIYLKKQSRKHYETMTPPTGSVQKWTQYQIDNPGYIFFPQVRGICTPAADQLQLFQGNFDGRTEHHLNFVQFQESPRPRTSFKKREEAHNIGGVFYGTTSTGIYYQPIPIEQRVAELKSVDRLAAQVGRYQKDGQQMKKAHHFGGKFVDESVNKSDYFQFWQIGPRKRHGDRAERMFQPSKAKIASVSESRANFITLEGKPSESFKPLNTRFKALDTEQQTSGDKKIKMDYASVYKQDFKEKQLPIREVCPAELILQQA